MTHMDDESEELKVKMLRILSLNMLGNEIKDADAWVVAQYIKKKEKLPHSRLHAWSWAVTEKLIPVAALIMASKPYEEKCKEFGVPPVVTFQFPSFKEKPFK